MELKPCVFCGSPNVVMVRGRVIYFVSCITCVVRGPLANTESEAARLWNTRAEWQPIETAPREEE